MESNLTLMPGRRNQQHGYGLAYQLAREQLAKIKNIEQQCQRSGTQYIAAQKALIIRYLNHSYQVTLPDIEISLLTKEEEVPIRDQILILHYLTMAKGTPLSNEAITYKELRDGVNYFPTFYQRAIKPLVNTFGDEPRRLLTAAGMFDAHKADYGDVAVTISAFSKVPITLVLWQGDEELAPEGNIMFDRTISDYLSTEDITVLCEIIAWRLVKRLKAGGDSSGNNRG